MDAKINKVWYEQKPMSKNPTIEHRIHDISHIPKLHAVVKSILKQQLN